MSSFFDAEDKSLRDILTSDEIYKIPRYQRPYSWTIDETSDLWNDLDQEDSIFLGSFVFNYEKLKQDNFVEVIDGQQRLITLTILLAIIRDLYRNLGDEKRAGITQQIIAHTNLITLEENYRLVCNESISDFFVKNIQKENSEILKINPIKKEEKLVKENYKFLQSKIEGKIDQYSEKSKKIQFLDDLKKKIFDFKIIWIKIENDEDAYSIFETVNARGADLTAADLLKNYLLSKLPKSEEDAVDFAKDTWSEIESNIESAKGLLTVSKFIRYFWLSKYSFISEKKLYKEVKRNITDPRALLSDILIASEYYYKMANDTVTINDWIEDFEQPKTAQQIFEALSGLRKMGITQCYSFILCLLLNKEKINFDFSYMLKTLEKYHFAYSAICKLSGNVVERVYFHAIQEINKSLTIKDDDRRSQGIQRAFSNLVRNLEYPSKELFIEKFLDIEYKKYPLVIYILSSIERNLGTADEKIINFTKVNIEHVLPKEPRDWGLEKDKIKYFVNKLGNLTLISKKINGPMGNKPLKQKAKLFKKSELKLNIELVKLFKNVNYKWGEKEIQERQVSLANFAYDNVWKFK